MSEIDGDKESNKSGGSFSIDMLPIVDRDDKMKFLSDLSIVQGLSKNKLIELGFETGNSLDDYLYIPEKLSTFIYNLKNQGFSLDSGSFQKINDLRNIGIPLFKVKYVSKLGSSIIIRDDGENLFYGDFDKYLSNGLEALKITNEDELNKVKADMLKKEAITYDGGLLKIKVENKFHSVSAYGYCIADDNKIAVLKNNKLRYYSYDKDSCTPEKEIYDLSEYGNITHISTDINNNFYFIITQNEGISKLRIINRATLQEVQEAYDDIEEIIYMSHKEGKLFCKDKDGYLRIITILTNSLPRGYVDNHTLTIQDNSTNIIRVQDTTAQKLIEVLEQGGLKLTPDMDENTHPGETLHAEIIEEIWNIPVGESSFRQVFEEAQDIEDIDMVQKLFVQIQQHPLVMSVPGITDGIKSKIEKKCFSILLQKVKSDIQKLRNDLQDISGEQDERIKFTKLIHLQTKLTEIEKNRSQIPDVDVKLDTEISTISGEISSNISDIRSANSAGVLASLEDYFVKIQSYFSAINYLPQITSVYDTDIYKETLKIIDFFDLDEKKTQLKRLDDMIQARMSVVEQVRKSGNQKRQKEIEEKITEIHTEIASIQRVIASINDSTVLSSIESSDPLVLKIRDNIKTLPKAEGDVVKISLENIFKERNQEIRISQLYSEGVSASLDEYGIDTSLYYADVGQKSVGFKLEGKRTPEGNIRLALHYDDGTVFDIDSYLQNPGKYSEAMVFTDIPTELSQKDFIEHQKNYRDLCNIVEKNKKKVILNKNHFFGRIYKIISMNYAFF